MAVSSPPMRGAPRRSGLIVLLIVVGLMANAVPCPDDLAVDAGAPDQCLASGSTDDSPAPAPSVCLCACHLAFSVTPAIGVALCPPVAEVQSLVSNSALDAAPARVFRPPIV